MPDNLIIYTTPELPSKISNIFGGTEEWEHGAFGQPFYGRQFKKIVVIVPTAMEAIMLPGQFGAFTWYCKEYLPSLLSPEAQMHYLHIYDLYSIIKTDGQI